MRSSLIKYYNSSAPSFFSFRGKGVESKMKQQRGSDDSYISNFIINRPLNLTRYICSELGL